MAAINEEQLAQLNARGRGALDEKMGIEIVEASPDAVPAPAWQTSAAVRMRTLPQRQAPPSSSVRHCRTAAARREQP